jgi:hypothetical protein
MHVSDAELTDTQLAKGKYQNLTELAEELEEDHGIDSTPLQQGRVRPAWR